MPLDDRPRSCWMVGAAIGTMVWSMNVIATAKIIAVRTRPFDRMPAPAVPVWLKAGAFFIGVSLQAGSQALRASLISRGWGPAGISEIASSVGCLIEPFVSSPAAWGLLNAVCRGLVLAGAHGAGGYRVRGYLGRAEGRGHSSAV